MHDSLSFTFHDIFEYYIISINDNYITHRGNYISNFYENTDAYLNQLFAPPASRGLFSRDPPPRSRYEHYILLAITLSVVSVVYSVVNQLISYAFMGGSLAFIYFVYMQRWRILNDEGEEETTSRYATPNDTNTGNHRDRSREDSSQHNRKPSSNLESKAIDFVEKAMKDKQLQNIAMGALSKNAQPKPRPSQLNKNK